MYVLEMKLLESRMMRKYQVRFRGGITEKGPLLPRRYPTRHVGWPQAGPGPTDYKSRSAWRARNESKSVRRQHPEALAGQ